MSHLSENSFSNILKSTMMLGAARAATIVIGMARIKVIALLLGPNGIGLFGSLEIIVTTSVYMFGLGTASSGVREIALARGSEDPRMTSVMIVTLRRLSLVLGVLGAALLALLAFPISQHSFGGTLTAQTILILSPAVLLTTLECGYQSNLKGLQRTRELTFLTVLAALLNSISAIIIVAQAGTDGVVISAVATALINCLLARWFVHRWGGTLSPVRWRESWRFSGTFIKLGIALTAALLMSAGVTYASRSIITTEISLAAVGIYMCAFTLSGKFVGFILDAMRLDFFPRLTSAYGQRDEFNRIINDQTEVILLLAIPGLFATMTFAPQLIHLFYSSEFNDATPLMIIFTIGCLWRVLGSPLGFVRIAAGRGKLYFWTEVITNAVHLGLIILLLKYVGLIGAAWAYFIHGILQTALLMVISHRISGFKWSSTVIKILVGTLPFATLLFYLCMTDSRTITLAVGLITTLVSGLLGCRRLSNRLPHDHRVNMLLRRIRLA